MYVETLLDRVRRMIDFRNCGTCMSKHCWTQVELQCLKAK